ncbi:MAG: hypothetical protein GY765_11960, partial [bacterium]|nr:hypothetical protein [bacterium]
PQTFPVYKNFFVDGETIYVQTFKIKNEKTEFLAFDGKGKFVKSLLVPLVYDNIMTPYLHTVSGGKVYQLVENMEDDEEEWELRIHELK